MGYFQQKILENKCLLLSLKNLNAVNFEKISYGQFIKNYCPVSILYYFPEGDANKENSKS